MSLPRKQLFCVLVTLLVGCSRAQQDESHVIAKTVSPAEQLRAVVEDYYARHIEMYPLDATADGDMRFNDRLTNDISEQAVADALALEKSSVVQLQAIDPNRLDAESRVNYDIFKYQRELAIEGFTFPAELLPIDQLDSVPFLFAEMGGGNSLQPFATTTDYDHFLKRVAGFVTWIDQAIVNLKVGATRGVVLPQAIVERVIARCATLAPEDATKSIFYKPIDAFPESVPTADRARLSSAYLKAIREQLTPSYRRLGSYLSQDYLAHARKTVGFSALPNGDAWYAYLVRYHTNSSLTPEQIHELGRQELQRVRGEMDKMRAQPGFKEDPKDNYASAEDILQAYAAIKQKVDAALPALFTDIPVAALELRPMEAAIAPGAGIAYFVGGTPDGKRPGVFYINTFEPASRQRYLSESIYLHEADPGHHLQHSLQISLTQLPRFRRFSYDTAYVEGWGLYAESLGRELGLYQDPHQYLGALTGESLRAARLVADTGIHAKGWTRDKAIDFMKENAALGDDEAAAEVDRYIAMPGQVLAYKIGQLKIRELRTLAEKRLGAKFDVRQFHRAVLGSGSMPLPILQAHIERWIEREKKKTSESATS